MSTFESKSKTPEGESSAAGGGGVLGARSSKGWADVIPKQVDKVGIMSDAEANQVWEKMYSMAGIPAGSEKSKKALRAGVYGYCALNGTSREGSYSGYIKLVDGTDVPAAIIPRAAGIREVRRFLRGCMRESYDFLKYSGWVEKQSNFIARCSNLGIGATVAFATADWLSDCEYFTPEEMHAHNRSFTVGITRARRARDGKTLEAVEDERVYRSTEAQGPAIGDNESVIHF